MLKIRFWPALVVVLVVVLGIRLGVWQRHRAHEKEALQALITRAEQLPPITVSGTPMTLGAVDYRRVTVHGHFLPQYTVYLDNRPYKGQPGLYVLTPLQLDEGGAVLINRGWLPRNITDRMAIAPYRTPSGEVGLTGLAREGPGRTFALGSGGAAEHTSIRQNLAVGDYARETGLPLQPFVVEQLSAPADGLVRDWPAPNLDVERNYGYMLQWWGLATAALLFGLYVARRAALAARARLSTAAAPGASAGAPNRPGDQS